MKLKVVIHEAEEGGCWAEVPGIPGCAMQGETFEELLQILNQRLSPLRAASDELWLAHSRRPSAAQLAVVCGFNEQANGSRDSIYPWHIARGKLSSSHNDTQVYYFTIFCIFGSFDLLNLPAWVRNLELLNYRERSKIMVFLAKLPFAGVRLLASEKGLIESSIVAKMLHS